VTKVISLISDFLLTAVTTAFILGVGLSCWLQAPFSVLFSLTAISCLLLLSCYVFHRQKTALLALLTTFFMLGFLHGCLANRPPADPSHIYNLIQENREVVVIGTLASMASFDGETSQALINLHSVRFADNPVFASAKGLIAVKMKYSWPVDILPGMMLAIRVELQRPSSFSTPGCFDYPAYLARQDIWITGHIRSPVFIHRIEHSPSLLHTLRFLPEYLRHQIAIRIDKAVAPPLQGVYRARIAVQLMIRERRTGVFVPANRA